MCSIFMELLKMERMGFTFSQLIKHKIALYDKMEVQF